MALPVIADTIRCVVFGTVEGGVGWSNTMHFEKDPTDTYANAINLIQAQVVKLYQQTGFGAGKSGWAQFNTDGTTVAGSVYTPLNGVSASTAFSFVQAGASSQAALPGQTAMSVTLNSALRGRSARGRVFWCCTSREVMASDGHVGATDITNCTAAWVAFMAALGGFAKPAFLVVSSYQLATNQRIISVTPRSVLAHQTKRRGRGA